MEGVQNIESKAGLKSPCLPGPAHLYLRMVRVEQRAVGSVSADAKLRVSSEEFSALALSHALSSLPPHIELPQGKIAADVLQAAGLAGYGRAVDGTTLEPIPLSPEAVLWPNDSLGGPWQEMIPLAVQPPAAGKHNYNAYQHLEWLRYWGFNGGLLGTLHSVGLSLVNWLESYLDLVDAAKVLIVGTTVVQNYIKRLAAGNLDSRLELVTPEQLSASQSIPRTNWDIICLINADSYLGQGGSGLVKTLAALSKSLFIGLFHDLDFRDNEGKRDSCATLLGLAATSPTHLIWRYLLRDPAEQARTLPEPTVLQLPKQTTQQSSSLGLAPYSYELRSFLRDAQHYETASGSVASFRPYYNQRPSYGSMDKWQLAWYLHWRDQVRQTSYPNTGLDYITLHALELVNGYGVNSVQDGYHQLMQLWLNYRTEFEPLDNWLPLWMCDYLLVNGSPIDPLLPLQQAAKLGVVDRYADLLLTSFVAQGWDAVPFALLERLSGISLAGTEIYTEKDREQIAAVVLRALADIDLAWREQDGRGILERLRPRQARIVKRLPFSKVLFGRSTNIIHFASSYAYSEQAAFTVFLTSIIKQTENLLRKKRGYRGRVRDGNPSAKLPTVVESSWQQARPQPQIVIDTDKVAVLTKQSDEVRDLLLAEAETKEEQAQPLQSQAQLEKTEPAKLNLSPWASLAACLGEAEVAALHLLAQPQGWQRLRSYCQSAGLMPLLLLDNINACALETIGDLLLDPTADSPELLAEYLPDVDVMLKELEAQREEQSDDNYT